LPLFRMLLSALPAAPAPGPLDGVPPNCAKARDDTNINPKVQARPMAKRGLNIYLPPPAQVRSLLKGDIIAIT
jgi:hypothetical protein